MWKYDIWLLVPSTFGQLRIYYWITDVKEWFGVGLCNNDLIFLGTAYSFDRLYYYIYIFYLFNIFNLANLQIPSKKWNLEDDSDEEEEGKNNIDKIVEEEEIDPLDAFMQVNNSFLKLFIWFY